MKTAVSCIKTFSQVKANWTQKRGCIPSKTGNRRDPDSGLREKVNQREAEAKQSKLHTWTTTSRIDMTPGSPGHEGAKV